MRRGTENLFLAGAWGIGWFLITRLRSAPATSVTAASRSVVIPARNEVVRLPALLQAVAAQLGPHDELIVVDDSSTDGTADAAVPFAKVITTEPPNGWLGKPWACFTGAQAAVGDVIVFLDSDVEVRPGLIDALASHAVESGGLVSMQPIATTQKPYEELSAMANAMTTLGAGTGECGSKTFWRAPMAFGPVMAIERKRYFEVGGHQEVRAEVAEDVAFAAKCGAAGLSVHAWLGTDLVSTRMYPGGMRDMTNGWSKNLAAGAAATAPLRMAAVVGWFSAVLHVAFRLRSTRSAFIYLAYAVQMHRLFAKVGRFSPLTALAFPVPALFFVYEFVRSQVDVRIRRSVVWRDRTVSL